MHISIPDRIVVFDYGEVISIEPAAADRAVLLDLAGADPDQFWTAYWHHRESLDQGTITVSEYWRAIESDVGADWDTARLHRLYLTDFRSWLAVDHATVDVLIDLQRGGTRMALLSNAGPDFASYYRHGMLGDFFDRVFLSGELGVLKPGPEIFELLISGLGVGAGEILFVDNREDNIRGAAALGIAGHVYTDASALRAYLETAAVRASPSETPATTDAVL